MDLERLKQRLPQLADRLDERWAAFAAKDPQADPADFAAYLRDEGLIDEGELRDLLTGMDVTITLSEAGPPPPDTGRYNTLGLLGKGAMGEVHIARDRLLRRNVAVKRMDPRVAADAALASRFHTEAQITAQLDHPSVVPVHTLEFPDGHTPEYTMKLIRGHDLAVVIKSLRQGYDRGERPDEDHDLPARLEWFLQVCAALSYAHERGVIHRDLKPANIMIGPFHEVVVMDWGIAKLIGGAEIDVSIEGLGDKAHETQLGSAIGTPPYMAPEQARGENAALDSRTDQSALGLVLFELVTLERAIVGNNPIHVIMRAQQGVKQKLRHYAGVFLQPISFQPSFGEDQHVSSLRGQVLLAPDEPPQQVLWEEPFDAGNAQVILRRSGLSPCLTISEGDTVVSGFCASLQVWAPGQPEDRVTVSVPPTILYIRFYPDYFDDGGTPNTRSMALRNPVLQIRAVPQLPDIPPSTALLAVGDSMRVGAHRFTVGELRRWGYFAVRREPPISLLWIGGGLFVLGLGLTLLQGVLRRRTPTVAT